MIDRSDCFGSCDRPVFTWFSCFMGPYDLTSPAIVQVAQRSLVALSLF
ncbi:hypothetical protein [Streptococcus pyogenes]|nr:hypothetical protein [Streptococcus pyogenes]HER5582863.1 hypothetical protein [Streptococcus pyogenes]HES5839224.1 hypothetical protein [Streptococcus pyogenes]